MSKYCSHLIFGLAFLISHLNSQSSYPICNLEIYLFVSHLKNIYKLQNISKAPDREAERDCKVF